MLIKEATTFHEFVEWIVYFNCFMGIGAYRLPNTTDNAYSYMQLYTIIFFIVNGTITYIGMTGMAAVNNENFSTMTRTMFRVIDFTNPCMAAASPFLIWLQRESLQDCFRQMPILDDTFQGLFGVRNEYRKPYIRLTCQIIAITLGVSVVSLCDLPWILLSGQSLSSTLAITITLHYPMINTLALDLNFCTCTRYLCKKFKDLNDGLLELAGKPSATQPENKISVVRRRVLKNWTKDMKVESLTNDKHHLLRKIRNAHLELCKLSKKINLAYRLQNLLSMGISFSVITGLLYTTYSTTVWEAFGFDELMKIVPSMNRLIIYVFKIWVVNHSSWSVSSEAGKTGEVIYELLETSVNRELQKEIQEFGVQILQNPVHFNAHGFFILDYTFVQSVIGSITTYLVILIQMSDV